MPEPVRIPLACGLVALVDAADAERVMAFRWHAKQRRDGKVKACRDRRAGETGPRTIVMHRFILGSPPGLVVDHIDGDTLNNTRGNLRACTVAENTRNQQIGVRNVSGFKGVACVGPGRFRAGIKCDGCWHYLGTYSSAHEAAAVYDAAALRLHGPFARTNGPAPAASPA